MAKRKHSAALFEVIRRNKPLDQQKPTSPLSRLASLFQSTRDAAPAPSYRTSEPEPLPPADEPQPQTHLSVNPDRREINLQLSYTSAAVAALAILTTVAGAFLAGQQMINDPRPLVATTTTEQLRNEPAQPSVLNVVNARRNPEILDPAPSAEPAANTAAAIPAPAPATLVARDRKRTIGLNYVIIQSYPDEKMAADAVKILAQNGIDCTVEKSLPGWGNPRTSWYSVVGIDGFSRISNSPQYDAYTRKIKDISDKFTKKNSFKAFDPKAYKWGKQS